jgi:chemotaxis protein methyltransferase CheR
MSIIERKATAALPSKEPAVADAMREFAFSDLDFRSLAQLAYEHAGIVLPEAKRNLVYGRLSRRLRALELTTFRDYREYLATHEGELQSFINSLSTNHTKFFRESHHFDHLRSQLAAPFSHSGNRTGSRRLRIWSAGCSSGEEPHTIAVVLKREIHDIERHDVRVLATDIDTDVLAKAARGVYPASAIDEVPAGYRSFFQSKADGEEDQVFMDPAVQKLITFRQLNLLGPWPFKGLYDAIFCRNVMIYFDGPTKSALVERFTQQVKPGGWLYIGHSESLIGSHPGLELVGRTIYRRVECPV